MLEIGFPEKVADELVRFAVIIARTDGKWIFCRHRDRSTYEIPGGRRENGEAIDTTARRELKEETGAVDFDIKPVCFYSVKGKTRFNADDDSISFGKLFIAEVYSFEALHSEIAEIIITDTLVESWTYPLIQPLLIEEAKKRDLV